MDKGETTWCLISKYEEEAGSKEYLSAWEAIGKGFRVRQMQI